MSTFYGYIFIEFFMKKFEFRLTVIKMRADLYWGLTGTTDPDLNNVVNMIPYFIFFGRLENVLAENLNGHNEFIKKFVKRNKPDLQLPPLNDEIIWVNLPKEESILRTHKAYFGDKFIDIIIKCYYQLAVKRAAEIFMTLRDVQNKMSQSKIKEIGDLDQKIAIQVQLIKKLREDPKIEMKSIESQENQ